MDEVGRKVPAPLMACHGLVGGRVFWVKIYGAFSLFCDHYFNSPA